MQLYHATPKANLDCIRREGLDPNRSQGKLKVVWLHTQSRRDWAILHTSMRHKCDISEVAIIEVNVPRSKIRRRRRGLWTTPEPISTTEFGRIADASEFAESSV